MACPPCCKNSRIYFDDGAFCRLFWPLVVRLTVLVDSGGFEGSVFEKYRTIRGFSREQVCIPALLTVESTDAFSFPVPTPAGIDDPLREDRLAGTVPLSFLLLELPGSMFAILTLKVGPVGGVCRRSWLISSANSLFLLGHRVNNTSTGIN